MAKTYNGFKAENTYREIMEIQEFQDSAHNLSIKTTLTNTA